MAAHDPYIPFYVATTTDLLRRVCGGITKGPEEPLRVKKDRRSTDVLSESPSRWSLAGQEVTSMMLMRVGKQVMCQF